MTECVILFRNTQNGAVGYVPDDEGEQIAVFPHIDDAIAAVPHVPILRAFPYQIVKLDEL